MKLKYLALLFVIISVLLAGCAEKEDSSVQENSELSSSSEQGLEGENEDNQPEVLVGEGEEHMVRLEYYNKMTPPSLEIPRGDTVSWWSQKRQGNFVLISEDGLFPAEELSYRVPFEYTFTEAGTYFFTVEEVPEMNLTVTVK